MNNLVALARSLRNQDYGDMRIDSRQVRQGDIFLALPGTGALHGAAFIETALEAGATLVLIDRSDEARIETQDHRDRIMLVDNLSLHLGQFAAAFYDDPSHKLPVVGITGTDGKSSTAYFVAQFLSDKAPAYFIGTVGHGDWDALEYQENTTPSVVDVHRLIAQAVEREAPAVVMEVSSHAIALNRIDCVQFAAKVLTNLGRDHLDFHRTIEAYHATKVNWYQDGRMPKFSGVSGHEGYVPVVDVVAQVNGIEWHTVIGGHQTEIRAKLIGDFHAENISLAVNVVHSFTAESVEALIEKVLNLRSVVGRMQLFQRDDLPTVVVDFAHTADALHRAISALKSHRFGAINVVFGCGGDRDPGKRPLMGKVATEEADFVFITNDNPRTEVPEAIVQDILKGIVGSNFVIQLDRAQAIAEAIAKSPLDSVVLVAGKGHETDQIVGTTRYHFSDVEEVGKIFGVQP
ncbi:MAG: UDP-N-acetylmuramoyl-L-alanyl-D-glutamate--2,6-diaminopimelate ligase [Gammaproteobacteria bacterium]|nr:UDP-N-acetylmuramoyl-L-alanyl-D-glutamate--2,6-diaminopimelate ligase [Gammaproteobacteria bacterium]